MSDEVRDLSFWEHLLSDAKDARVDPLSLGPGTVVDMGPEPGSRDRTMSESSGSLREDITDGDGSSDDEDDDEDEHEDGGEMADEGREHEPGTRAPSQSLKSGSKRAAESKGSRGSKGSKGSLVSSEREDGEVDSEADGGRPRSSGKPRRDRGTSKRVRVAHRGSKSIDSNTVSKRDVAQVRDLLLHGVVAPVDVVEGVYKHEGVGEWDWDDAVDPAGVAAVSTPCPYGAHRRGGAGASGLCTAYGWRLLACSARSLESLAHRLDRPVQEVAWLAEELMGLCLHECTHLAAAPLKGTCLLSRGWVELELGKLVNGAAARKRWALDGGRWAVELLLAFDGLLAPPFTHLCCPQVAASSW